MHVQNIRKRVGSMGQKGAGVRPKRKRPQSVIQIHTKKLKKKKKKKPKSLHKKREKQKAKQKKTKKYAKMQSKPYKNMCALCNHFTPPLTHSPTHTHTHTRMRGK